jgi:alpha-glucosidase
MLRADPDRRPFVLTRSNFMGGHRYAATWTGDNSAKWADLALSIPMVLSLSLSGQLMSGPDIGGFVDHTEGDPELFARWMGIGCLLPFARAHVARGCIDKEPWSLGPECEATCRRAIELRYRLLPHLYTLAWRAHRTGAPIAAPVFFADPADPALRSEDRAFLLGEDLMAVCDVRPAADRENGLPVALPERGWRLFTLGDHDPALPQLRLREGAAIATGPVMQHSDERPVDPLTVVAALDADGRAEGLLYEDAGDGFAFEGGAYRLSRIVVDQSEGGARIVLEHAGGDLPAIERRVTLRTV